VSTGALLTANDSSPIKLSNWTKLNYKAAARRRSVSGPHVSKLSKLINTILFPRANKSSSLFSQAFSLFRQLEVVRVLVSFLKTFRCVL
jgi:hypothetical protein